MMQKKAEHDVKRAQNNITDRKMVLANAEWRCAGFADAEGWI